MPLQRRQIIRVHFFLSHFINGTGRQTLYSAEVVRAIAFSPIPGVPNGAIEPLLSALAPALC